jgi:hypothetical protein
MLCHTSILEQWTLVSRHLDKHGGPIPGALNKGLSKTCFSFRLYGLYQLTAHISYFPHCMGHTNFRKSMKISFNQVVKQAERTY